MSFIFNSLLLSKWWHSAEIKEIETVIIIEDNTLYPSNTLRGLSNSITSTMLFGVIGAKSAAAQNQTKFDVDLDIYTPDGKVFEIHTDEPKLLKYLLKWVYVEDPRDKYRKIRGV